MRLFIYLYIIQVFLKKVPGGIFSEGCARVQMLKIRRETRMGRRRRRILHARVHHAPEKLGVKRADVSRSLCAPHICSDQESREGFFARGYKEIGRFCSKSLLVYCSLFVFLCIVNDEGCRFRCGKRVVSTEGTTKCEISR